MKNLRIGLFSFLLISITSCSKSYDRFAKLSEMSLKATDSENIELFFTDNISRPYEPIGYININMGNGFGTINKNQTNFLRRMKEMAAKNGANAIVNINTQNAQGYTLIGLAVKWK